ncbi:MAG: hypothetical protein H7177_06260 [Rhizobacter sp.]|nr:hypothetical protein [Bacteriovorax sp.]
MKIFLIALSLLSQNFIALNALAADSNLLADKYSSAVDPLAKYNGISGQVPYTDPLNSNEYNQKNLDLTAIIWADTEISQKLCKPVGNEKPKSYAGWWSAVNKYIASEKLRNARILSKQAELTKKVEELKGSNNFTNQTDVLKLQIEGLNIMIDSISGSSLSSEGSSGVDSTSRLAAREELLASSLVAQEDALSEDKNMTVAYDNCLYGVETSSSIASNACDYSTKGCARTKNVCDKDKCWTAPDPVAGSCELKEVSCPMANTSLPLFKRVSLIDLKTLYTIAPIPSKQINERLLNLLNLMNQQINILFSKSTDANYDWTTPLQACLAPIEKIVKANGVICPTDSKAGKDFDQSTFDHLGRSTDLFAESSRLIVGSTAPAGTSSYLAAKNFFTDKLQLLTKDPINKNKTPKELENMALANLWQNWFAPSQYTQNFLAGRPQSYGLNPADEQKYVKEVMVRNNETDLVCNARSCQNPIEPPPVVKIIVPEYARVTESAKAFLDAAGIKDSLGEEMGIYLSDKWNNSDLSVGQSFNRKFYFKYTQELIEPLLASDRAKLSSLLLNRKKLIDYYESLIKSLNKKGTNIARLNEPTTNQANSVGINEELVSGNTLSSVPNDPTLSATQNLNLMSDIASTKQLESDLLQASSGLMSFGATNLAGGNTGAINAIKYSKNVNDKINKSLSKISDFEKQRTKGQLGDENKKFEAFSKKMASKMSPKSIATANSLLSRSSLDNSSPTGKPQEDKVTTTEQLVNTPKIAKSYNDLAYSGSHRSYPVRSMRTATKVPNNAGSNEYSKSVNQASISTNEEEISDDQKRILDAINARNKRISDYNSDEDDSIFLKLTKAYIRSYEKLK